jgi:outer membrane immunogenic protein
MNIAFAKVVVAGILIATAVPAAAQTTDELKARIAALEKENAKLHEELTSHRTPSMPRGPARVPELAMPTKSLPVSRSAAAAPPPLSGSWTGFYVGGNLGISTGKNVTDSTVRNTFLGGLGGPFSTIRTETFDLSPQGGLAGLQAGYNWQVSRRFVVGVEGDLQWTNANGQGCVLNCSDPVLHSGGLVYAQALSSFGTLRGRAGWTSGPSFFYLTSGSVYGRFDTDMTHTEPGIGHLANVSEGKWGWTGGGGIESQIAGNLTAKIEYLYLDLGNTGGQGTFNFPGQMRTFAFSSQLHELQIWRSDLCGRLQRGRSGIGAGARLDGILCGRQWRNRAGKKSIQFLRSA